MKIQFIAFLVGFVFCLLFVGCGEQAGEPEGAMAPTKEISASVEVGTQLAGTQWEVRSVEGLNLPDSMRRPHLRFDADGSRVSGFSGVNRISGGYTELDNHIRLGNLAGTKMAGSPEAMAFESAFMQVLRGDMKWSVADDHLTLSRDDGVAIHLRAVPYEE